MASGKGLVPLDTQYRECVEILYTMLPMFQRVGPVAYKKDLTNTKVLLQALGDPQLRFRSIHVAGTNGKGSLTHLLAALFVEQGLRTGIYTSPHYKDFRERIKIGPNFIPKRDVIGFVRDHQALIETVKPSFFELTVVMAFWYFAREKVDVAIVETGLGGRLDSTNVITPELSVITNIGWDHMDLLGHTLPEIATEKAGIIKKGVPVVIGEVLPETRPVFLKKASEMGSMLRFAEESWECTNRKGDLLSCLMDFRSSDGRHLALETDLTGPFQDRNFRTFLTACDALEGSVFPKVQPDRLASAVRSVREKVRYIGRWQVRGKDPLIILDSAHNKDGLELLFEGISRIPHRMLHVVLGVVADKDLEKVIHLFPADARYYFAKANVPRGMDAHALRERCNQGGLSGRSYVSVKAALRAARRHAAADDLIMVCGSIFVVAEVI